MIADVLDGQMDLLHDLPPDGVLQGLADLGEAGHQGIAGGVGPVGIVGQQQLVPVAHRRQDRRVDAGIDHLFAAGAAHGPLHLVPFHGGAAPTTEPVGAIPGGQVQGRGPGQSQISRFHIAKYAGALLHQRRFYGIRHRPEEEEGRLIDLKEIDQLVFFHPQGLYLRRGGKSAALAQIGLPAGENGDKIAGKTLALVKFVVKYMGKYVLDHGVLASQ